LNSTAARSRKIGQVDARDQAAEKIPKPIERRHIAGLRRREVRGLKVDHDACPRATKDQFAHSSILCREPGPALISLKVARRLPAPTGVSAQ
jgi:hypothetical protein